MSKEQLRYIAVALVPVDDRVLAGFGRDDIGNAERFRAREGENFAVTPGLGVLWFDGRNWAIDEGEVQAAIAAQRTARAIETEVVEFANDNGLTADERKAEVAAHQKWVVASGNAPRLKAMLQQAWPYLQRAADAWNTHGDLFNVQNGTLDLSSIEVVLRPYQRGDLLTRMAGVAYDPAAECPAWRAFIAQVLPDPEVAAFVKRVLGACLIDSSRDQALIVFHGAGANGKSTLLNAVSRVMGDYCMSAASQSLLYSEQSGSAPSPDIARLAEGPRLVRMSEPEAGSRLSEGAVKGMTGNEPIVARRLHEAPIEFVPAFKIILSCNNRPNVRSSDDGIWRRILLVPWTVQISPEERREKGAALEAALAKEGPGILNWMLEGLQDYRERNGLCPPEAVLNASQTYRAESDLLGRFLAEACVRNQESEINAKDFYSAFKLWAAGEGVEEVPSQARIGRKLTDLGFGRRKRSGVAVRLGLALSEETMALLKCGAANDN